jgi:hypothetical protein
VAVDPGSEVGNGNPNILSLSNSGKFSGSDQLVEILLGEIEPPRRLFHGYQDCIIGRLLRLLGLALQGVQESD